MLVIQPPVIFSIFTQHLIRIFALEVLATRFDLISAPPSPSCRSCLVYSCNLDCSAQKLHGEGCAESFGI
jgi:hypothetical protein